MKQFFVFLCLLLNINASNIINNRRKLLQEIFPPVVVHPLISKNVSFIMLNHTNNTDSIDLIRSKVHEVKTSEFDETQTIEEITKYILFALDLNQSTIIHMQWNFKITVKVGIMTQSYIMASIFNKNITLTSKSITAEQSIPPFYTTETVCARTGRRKYGFAGPRSMECSNVIVPRGINAQEIELVKTRLTQKLDEIKF